PMQIAEMANDGVVDFAIATEALEMFGNLVMLPCYTWNRSVVVPKDHPLASVEKLTLQALAKHPIVTYVFGFTGRSQLDDAFQTAELEPNVVFTAADSDVIKTYVRLGLGVGIVATMAYDEAADSDLVALDASHLFADSTTKIGIRNNTFIRGYMYKFIQSFAPHLTQDLVMQAMEAPTRQDVEVLFEHIELPRY
ncbi:MAG: LysR substrate-binding domain-containing protein, partial [Marinomonas gallaica]